MSALDWMGDCAEGALKYGAGVGFLTAGGASGAATAAAAATTGAAVGASAGVTLGAGAVVGGIYGCLVESGASDVILKKMERAASDLGSFFARQGKRASRWSLSVVDDIVDFLGGVTEKQRARRTPPPTLDIALAMLAHFFDKLDKDGIVGENPTQFQMDFEGKWRDVSAAWPLHHSNRAALYGDAAVGWNADALCHALAVIYTRTPRSWPSATRMVVAVKRLGDYLVESPSIPLTQYPVLDPKVASSHEELYGEQREAAHEADENKNKASRWALPAVVVGAFGAVALKATALKGKLTKKEAA